MWWPYKTYSMYYWGVGWVYHKLINSIVPYIPVSHFMYKDIWVNTINYNSVFQLLICSNESNFVSKGCTRGIQLITLLLRDIRLTSTTVTRTTIRIRADRDQTANIYRNHILYIYSQLIFSRVFLLYQFAISRDSWSAIVRRLLI